MPHILFSVVIPTYNRADLILETIDTVLTQSYSNYEIIVVDNCSTDNTDEVLASYIKQKKIIYIKNDKNYERAHSRNVGMANANGDFLTLLDSDDFMYPDCLKNAYEFIEKNSWCKVFHNLFEIVDSNRKLVYKVPFQPITNQYKALCSGNFMSAIGGFIHKEIYNLHRFNLDPKMIGAEDYEFWFQILAKYKLGRIKIINSGLREHPARSVNIDAYDHIKYQCTTLIDIINSNSVLSSKFKPYIGRLAASFKLQEVYAYSQSYSFFKKIKLLFLAAKDDFTIIFTKRYLATAINIVRK